MIFFINCKFCNKQIKICAKQVDENKLYHCSMKCRTLNPEYKKKLSEKRKEMFKIGLLDLTGQKNPMFGRKHSKTSRDLMSAKKIDDYMTGKTKLNKPWLGKKRDESFKNKLKQAFSGQNNPAFGKSLPIDRKIKISKKFTGGNYETLDEWNVWRTKNGKYPKEWTYELKEKVKKRDDYTCQICRYVRKEKQKSQNIDDTLQLHVHHIDFIKSNCKEENLITLCNSCHGSININNLEVKNLLKEKTFSKKQEL